MISLLTLVFLLSWSLTWYLRRLALAKNILDVPNQRSSHTIPTPRGGGLAFVITFFIALPWLIYQNHLTWYAGMIFMTGGFLIAAAGFLDDLGYLNVRWRLFGHFVASILAVWGLGGLPEMSLFIWTIPGGYILNILAVIYVVWLLNLYNFMDGIDGIAGVEAITVCLGAACLYWLSGAAYLMALPLILASCVAGFLYWNAPIARIFMGDAGSGFLGFMLGALSIQSAHAKPQFFWSWLILLGVFIVDATITLITRAIHGAKLYEAHRTHAYQHASRMFARHYRVTMAVFVINMLWLCPIALCVGLGYLEGGWGLGIAYLPLMGLAFMFNAGRVEQHNRS